MNDLSCDDVRRTLSTGGTLLDVRTTNEFNNGCLANAKNIPLAVLPLLAQQYFERDDPVLIYCHSGNRAIMYRKYGISQGARDGGAIIAEKILASLGFTDVTNIGGIHHYQHCH